MTCDLTFESDPNMGQTGSVTQGKGNRERAQVGSTSKIRPWRLPHLIPGLSHDPAVEFRWSNLEMWSRGRDDR